MLIKHNHNVEQSTIRVLNLHSIMCNLHFTVLMQRIYRFTMTVSCSINMFTMLMAHIHNVNTINDKGIISTNLVFILHV